MSEENKPFKNLRKKVRQNGKPSAAGNEQEPREDGFARAMQDVHPLDDPRGRKKDSQADQPDGLHSPFADLAAKNGDEAKSGKKNAKRPKRPPKPEPAPEKPAPPEPGQAAPPPDEADLFIRAMQGAEPLKGKGRRVAPAPPKSTRKPESPDSDAQVMEELNRLVNGDIQFTLEFTDEYMHGQVNGLDSRVFQKLKHGRISFESHIDLHGMNLEQAGLALIDFIREQYMKGSRCVLVVHGRGMNSPQGRSVLKHEVQRWLTRDPLRRVVMAFVTAMPRHGGAGAIYVLLRKYKKTRGKVRWDRLPPDLSWPE